MGKEPKDGWELLKQLLQAQKETIPMKKGRYVKKPGQQAS